MIWLKVVERVIYLDIICRLHWHFQEALRYADTSVGERKSIDFPEQREALALKKLEHSNLLNKPTLGN